MQLKNPPQKIHQNIPQLLFAAIMAQINIILWGRATGKTEGPMCRFTLHNIQSMPRSNGFLIGTTYEQLLTRTLPPLVAAWEKYGYRENEHYWVQKFPEAKLKIPKALRIPLRADNYIQWFNGSGIYLVSQDRPGSINGVRTQWGAGDEAKLLNHEKLKNEALLTMAGFPDVFGHLSNYLSLLFCSDMPTTSKGTWLIDYKSQMDEKTINAILMLAQEISRLQHSMQNATELTKFRVSKEIARLSNYVNDLRKNTVYCSYASTVDNIHAIGLEPFKQFRRTLKDLEFQISVLNQRILQVENGFYGLLDEEIHGYNAVNYSHVDQLNHDFKNPAARDCRWDADLRAGAPIDISADYNHAINSVVIGQASGRRYNVLNSMYVLGSEGKKLKDLAQQFCDYYLYHDYKYVNYFYDNTAIAKSASTDISFADEWYNILAENGWTVNMIYIGQASSHKSRFLLWQMTFSHDQRLSIFRYNLTNCADLQISMQQAKTIQSGIDFKKDKTSERDKAIPPQHATHFSEALDCLWYGTQRHKIGEQMEFVDAQLM